MVLRRMKGWQEGHVPAQATTYSWKEGNSRYFGFQASKGSMKGSLPHTKLMTQTWSHYCKHLSPSPNKPNISDPSLAANQLSLPLQDLQKPCFQKLYPPHDTEESKISGTCRDRGPRTLPIPQDFITPWREQCCSQELKTW